MKEKFLIDTNTFTTPNRQYYAFDIVPAFWDEIAKQAATGRLILLDLVREEINKGKDSLSEWVGKQTDFVECSHVSEEIINKYAEIIQYVQDSELYDSEALHNWAKGDLVDPWLIAAAAVNGYTIITFEGKSGGISKKNPSHNPKIPDVAKEFDVKVEKLFYMMRQLGIKI